MFIFTCEDRFEDMMCCIYRAWEYALQYGHDNIMLKKEPVLQHTLFDTYIHVDYDEGRAQKVIRTIERKLSGKGLYYIYYATLSNEEDALNTIYHFLVKGFQIGPGIFDCYGEPEVMRIFEIKRRVGNEAHFFREFARFTSLDDRVYVCHLEPKNNVITIVANHFADRMPSEYFMIIDDNRCYAVVHPKDGENYIRYLTEEEMAVLCQTESYEDQYTDLWRTFFDTIGIQERENPTCQRNMMPLWMRKHAVEFFPIHFFTN